MKDIILKINEARRLCLIVGRKPIAIAMNAQIREELFQEVTSKMGFEAIDKIKAVETIMDMRLLKCEAVKDFLILDDRHWYEQKF